MKRKWIWHDGRFVEIDAYAPPRPRKGPYIQGDYEAYDCPITGRMIDGRAAHRENLARHGCRVLEPGESKEQPRRVEEHFEKTTAEIVDRMASDMAKMI